MSEWKTISIRQELIKEIEKIIKTGRYRSISEFVSEAIRFHLQEPKCADAGSTGKPQETFIMEYRTVKATPNPEEEEKVQRSEPLPSEETQPQAYQAQVQAQQKDADAIPK
jgi:Arc/MetJ-type ribon-helix-helix transcriptional regulator